MLFEEEQEQKSFQGLFGKLVGSLEICRSRDAVTAENGVRYGDDDCLFLGWVWGTETEKSLVAMSVVWVSWSSHHHCICNTSSKLVLIGGIEYSSAELAEMVEFP
ncbi:hypothetical protein L6452_35684 [Arctium lappa]|uniref:Uncharacterized protein n=1 Tax=Arctium lappa TaxID=4217 RepID=A0ACB8Y7U3_ARCLA|nr:hypothetical protein L6452_35684 [Arctium lappa]